MHINTPLGYTGYGVAGLNITLAMHKKLSIALWPKGNPTIDSQRDADILGKIIKNNIHVPYDAPCLKIWHQFDLLERIGKGKYLAFPFFELDKFDEREQYHIKFPDHVFVTSKWGKEIVEQYRPNNVSVVPLGINPEIFKPSQTPTNGKTFVVANFGKWEKRKGHDVIPTIFNNAFNFNDKVELRMYPHNPFLTEAQQKVWEVDYHGSKLGHKIHIRPRINTHQELAQEMSEIDVAIFPSRGEGWNLELLEVMAMGKPVVATNYSAHTEFCTTENSILVDIIDKELAMDGKWFFGQGYWAQLGNEQIEAFSEALRSLYKKWREDGPLSLFNAAGVATGQHLTWDHVCDKIKEHL